MAMYSVTRTWWVEADSAGDAVERTKDTLHEQVEARQVPDRYVPGAGLAEFVARASPEGRAKAEQMWREAVADDLMAHDGSYVDELIQDWAMHAAKREAFGQPNIDVAGNAWYCDIPEPGKLFHVTDIAYRPDGKFDVFSWEWGTPDYSGTDA